MKKLIGLGLSLLLLMQTAWAGFQIFDDVAGDAQLEKALDRLVTLEIVDKSGDGTFLPDAALTRAEFCRWMVRAMALEDAAQLMGKQMSNAFTDVSSDDENYSYIAYAASLGMVQGNADGTFRPRDPITCAQAVKIMFSALGYDAAAQARGGYPSGYLMFALDNGVLRGIRYESDGALSRRNAAVMLSRVMDIGVCELINGKYTINKEATLAGALEEKVQKSTRSGLLCATDVTSLPGTEVADDGYVQIGDDLFAVGATDAQRHFGYQVDYSFQYDEARGEYYLLDIRPSARLTTVEIDAEDIISASMSSIQYYEDKEGGGQRKTNAPLEAGFHLVYNGMGAAGVSAQMLKPDLGKVTLVSFRGDGTYQTVIVQNVRHYIVERVDAKYGRIYLKNDLYGNLFQGKNYIEITLDELEDGPLHKVEDMRGKSLSIDSITDECVIAVQFAEEDAKGEQNKIILPDTVSGQVEAYSDESITIDGIEYHISKTGQQRLADTVLEAGQTKTFYLDYYGDVAGLYSEPNSDSTYAYLQESYGFVIAAGAGGGMGTLGQVKLAVASMANRNGVSILTFDFADSIQMNGVRRSGSSAAEALRNMRQPVRFSVNAQGKINKLFVSTQYADKKNRKYNLASKRFDSDFYINQRTSVLFVPSTYSENDIRNMLYTPIVNGKSYMVTPYDVTESGVANVIVIEKDPQATASVYINDEANYCYLLSVIQYTDAENSRRYKLKLFRGGKVEEYVVMEDEALHQQVALMQQGDIFRIGQNIYGEIGKIQTSVNGHRRVSGVVWNDETAYDVARNRTDSVWISAGGDGTDTVKLKVYASNPSDSHSSQVYVVESGTQQTLAVGSFKDLLSVQQSGSGSGVRVTAVYETSSNEAKVIYIFKN